MRTALLLMFAFTSLVLYARDIPGNIKGQVLVKLKPTFAYMNADGRGMRAKAWSEVTPALQVKNAVAFSQFESPTGKNAKKSAGKSGVDLRLYHQISFDPSIPVEEAIMQLYKSGMVELAEPVYPSKSTFTPNDPLLSQQYHISLIKALEAWDITKGSENIIIAILDSGVDLNHPDLKANIWKNEADPIDDVDNDGDGFVDNYWGWDFAGDDFATLEWDNDPNANKANIGHGTQVAGCASAVTNNGVGVAGVGFNSKLMVLKHTADNDTRNDGMGYLDNLLFGVLYAADHGATVINASFGNTYFSQIAQDIYTYAAIDKSVLVVAAAGNESSPEPHFPSDYDYVLSVAATTATDRRASFSNYGYKVDLSAPGNSIYTTSINNGYGAASGTSFAAPIVAGAAALAKAKYPDFNGVQIGELLRVTSDPAFIQNLSSTHQNRMGRGRLDVHRALTIQSPSVRFDSSYLQTPSGDVVKAGDEASLRGLFRNFLWTAENTSVTLSTLNVNITILEGTVALGTIGMNGKKSNRNEPFRFKVSPTIAPNTEVIFRLDFQANGYTDFQYIKILVNPSYYNITENLVSSTMAGNGRIGFQDTNQRQGLGFVYNDVNMLYEMGVIMATSETKLVSNVRSETGFSDDFTRLNEITRDKPGTVSDADVYGTFRDSGAPQERRLNVDVDFRGFVWREAPYEKMIIVEYEVTNRNTTALEGFYLGLYADWDINQTSSEPNDKADWDPNTKTGYIYTPDPENRLVGAIQVLTGTPNYWAIDNDADVTDNPFGVYDDFTNAEKFQSLSSGIGRAKAGATDGTDVSHTVGSGPYTIPAEGSVRIAFALHGGSSIEEVLLSAVSARELYESIEDVERPVARSTQEPTGIGQNEIPKLAVYPNPTPGKVTLVLPELTGRQQLQIRVLDTAGRLHSAREYTIIKASLEIEMPQHAGMYILEISQGKYKSIRRIAVMR